MIDEATNFSEATYPYFWYLAFGHLDEVFDVVYEMRDIDTAWTNIEVLEHSARILKASGYAAHPRFIPLQELSGMPDVWDRRGPPDDCNKVDGKWACW